MFRKLGLTVAIIAAAIAVVAPATSQAYGPKRIVFTVPKTVAVNYDHCADAAGNPLPCLTVDFTVANYTTAAVQCTVTYDDLNFVALDALVPTFLAVGGNITTPYTGQKSLRFTAECGGGRKAYRSSRKVRAEVPVTS
jgi:hypothetical protein